MLALLELLHAVFMAFCASVGGREFYIGDIIGSHMSFAVTDIAGDFVLAVFADLPIAHNTRRHFLVALDAFLAPAQDIPETG
jgi:hypothetical protein